MVFGFGKLNIENLEKKKDVKGLIKDLNSKNDNVIRLDAVKALGSIGDPAVEPLINLLHDNDGNVRLYGASALGSIGDRRAVEPLTNALQYKDELTRKTAAEALKKITDKQ